MIFRFFAFLFLILTFSCASYKPFEDSAPLPADKIEFSDEGWNGADFTQIADPTAPTQTESASNVEQNEESDKIEFSDK